MVVVLDIPGVLEVGPKPDPTTASPLGFRISAEVLACIQRKPWLAERAEAFEV